VERLTCSQVNNIGQRDTAWDKINIPILLLLLVLAMMFSVNAWAEEVDLFILHGSGQDITEDYSEQDLTDEIAYTQIYEDILTYATASGSAMKTSDTGVELICKWEGCRLTAYKALSTEKYYTIGYGHNGPDVTEGMTITKEQARELLKSDIAKFEGYVNNFINKYGFDFNQNQFDALVSFTYNIGTVWISDSTLKNYMLDGLDKHTDDDIRYAFGLWCKSGGKFVQGLYNRRMDEAALFLTPIETTPEPEYPKVDSVNLNLEGCIGLNFYIFVPDNISSKVSYAKMNSTKYGTKTIALSDAQHSENGNATENTGESSASKGGLIYAFSYDLPFKDIDQYVTIELYDSDNNVISLSNSNNGSGTGYIYSAELYVADKMESADENLARMLNSLVLFGDWCKVYFDGGQASNVYNVPSSELNSYEKKCTGTVDGIELKGSSLILASDTAVRHYFGLTEGAKIEDFSFICDGKNLTPATKGGLFYIDIANIPGARLDDNFKVIIRSRTGVEMTIEYSAMSYVYAVRKKADAGEEVSEALINLVNSMYWYNRAAKTYFGSN